MSDYNFTNEMMEKGDTVDNLRNIVHMIFDNDEDSCIHDNYRPGNAAGRNIDTTDAKELLDDASSYFIYEHLGLCGCGIPNASLQKVVDYLEIANQWSKDINESTDLWHDHKPSENRQQGMKEKFGVKDECEDPLVQFLVYIIDHNGFTDHGSSITGCWITDKGRACLYVLKLYLEKSDEEEEKDDN